MNYCLKVIGLLVLTTLLSCGPSGSIDDSSKVFSLNLEVEDKIVFKHKVKSSLIEIATPKNIEHESKVKRRGGSSSRYSKYSFEVDLKKDVSIAGLPEDDDWILNANYIDKTFLRHVFSYELFSSMHPNNLSSGCRFVELKINGKYNGLYVLMEKLDRSSLELEGSDSLAMIFKEPHIFRATYDGVKPQREDNFHQQTYPKIKNDDKRSFLENIRYFILNTSDEYFTEHFSKTFDLGNIIDWNLLLLISNNSDGILKNFYLYKKDNSTPLRIAPWDYDHSFGRDGDNQLNIDRHFLNVERSILFKRLLTFDWYKNKLTERWMELNDSNILSSEGLTNKLLEKSKLINKFAAKNFELWPLKGKGYKDGNNYDQEIEIMLKFIKLRHGQLTEYFETNQLNK